MIHSNVDRILNGTRVEGSHDSLAHGTISFTDYGLLLCEVHLLRQASALVLPAQARNAFLEDSGDLIENKGLQRQRQAIDRIWRAYWQWLQ